MSFFMRNTKKSQQKRKIHSKKKKLHEEIVSSDEEQSEEHENAFVDSEDENETAQEKRLRLAKIYLEEIKKAEEKKSQNEEFEDTVQKRLKDDYMKLTGRLRLFVADQYKQPDFDAIITLKCKEHNNSLTALCVSSDDKFIYTGCKDGNIVKWSLRNHKKISSLQIVKHKAILSIAISSDSKFLCISDETHSIKIYKPENLQHLQTFEGHRGSITGLVFKKNSHTLYSCSKDRCLKIWNLDEMSYVETLYGHTDDITSIDALFKDRAISSGADSTIRLWKTNEESQLIFNGSANIDCVKFINEEIFISGNDQGELSVWMVNKKKPLCVVKESHGLNKSSKQANWITSIACFVNTDLIASGSNDGFLRLWKLSDNYQGLKMLFEIPIEGFVNSLGFSNDGNFLVAAIGKEQKFGRWEVIKSAKNSVVIIPLQKNVESK